MKGTWPNGTGRKLSPRGGNPSSVFKSKRVASDKKAKAIKCQASEAIMFVSSAGAVHPKRAFFLRPMARHSVRV